MSVIEKHNHFISNENDNENLYEPKLPSYIQTGIYILLP